MIINSPIPHTQVSLYLLAVLLLMPLALHAQGTSAWTKTNFGDNNYVNFIKELEGKLYVGSRYGLFRSSDEGTTWDTICTAGAVSAFIHHIDKYYIGSFSSGIWLSDDLVQWDSVSQDAPRVVTSILGVDESLYISTGDGVFKLDSTHTKWLKEPLNIASIHSNIIWHLDRYDHEVIAGGSDFCYRLDLATNVWDTLPGRIGYMSMKSKKIDDDIIFSTSGDGLYVKDAATTQLSRYETGTDIDTAKYIEDFIVFDSSIVYTGEFDAVFDTSTSYVCDDHLTSLFVYDNVIYAGTATEGIWKMYVAPDLQPRSIRNHSSLFVAPNPSFGEFYMNLSLEQSSRYHLFISDSNGKVIYARKIETGDANTSKAESYHISTPGTYYISLARAGERIVKRIIIQ